MTVYVDNFRAPARVGGLIGLMAAVVVGALALASLLALAAWQTLRGLP